MKNGFQELRCHDCNKVTGYIHGQFNLDIHYCKKCVKKWMAWMGIGETYWETVWYITPKQT